MKCWMLRLPTLLRLPVGPKAAEGPRVHARLPVKTGPCLFATPLAVPPTKHHILVHLLYFPQASHQPHSSLYKSARINTILVGH